MSQYSRNGFFNKTLLVAGAAAMLGLSSAGFAADTEPHSHGVGAAITDTAITTKVKAKYLDDSRLKGTDISVTTTNGIVTLTGSAPSSDSKTVAETLAKSVDGVKSVDDQVNSPSLADKVASKTDKAAHKTGVVVSDSWITTKVKSELVADSQTKGLDISVTTVKGVVALSGSTTDAERARAVSITKKVKGVKSVNDSDLKVSSS